MKTKTTYIKDKPPTLKELQKMVGGYIEVIEREGIQIVMDEEGKLKERPVNLEATKLWRGGVYYDEIVGDVVVLSGKARLT